MKTMKTTKILMMFSVAAIGLAAVGCDSTTTCADGGVCPDGGAGGKGGGAGGAGGAGATGGNTVYGITPGTYCFDITSATPISDGCGLFDPLMPFVGTRLPVTYMTTGQLTVGKMGSLGTGLINNNQGTLLRENDPVDSMMPLCTWHQTDQSVIQVTATNAFTANVTETESAFSAACGQPATADPCTSTFTFTLAIHSPALMPDATGACP